MTTHDTTAPRPPRRRADAERSVARILDAARRRAGGRPRGQHGRDRSPGGRRARDHLRALPDPRGAARGRHPARDRRGRRRSSTPPSPTAATRRRRSRGSSTASWRTLGRYHALVAINTQQHGHDELQPAPPRSSRRLQPLIERGQADGTFRADVPAAWHLSMLMALIHAASGELGAGRVDDAAAGPALVATILGAVTTRPGPDREPAQRPGPRGARVRIEPIGRERALALLAGRPEPELAWAEGFPPRPLLASLQRVIDDPEGPTRFGPFYAYVIVRRADGVAIGDAGFFGPPDGDGEVEIGYALVPGARGSGYAGGGGHAPGRVGARPARRARARRARGPRQRGIGAVAGAARVRRRRPLGAGPALRAPTRTPREPT